MSPTDLPRRARPRALLLLAALLAPALPACAPPPPAEPQGLVWLEEGERPYFHDFGAVEWGERVEHTFRWHNASDAPILLRDATGSCGCTSVRRVAYRGADGEEVEGAPRARDGMLAVPPQAELSLTVRIDTSKISTTNRDRLEILRLTTDSPVTPFFTLELHVIVRQLFQVTPKSLQLGETPRSAGGEAEIHVATAVPGSPARVTGIRSAPERFEVELEETFRNGESLWIVHARAPAWLPIGPVKDRVVLATSDAEGQGDAGELAIELWAQVVEDVVLSPPQIHLGVFDSGAGASAEARVRALVPGMRVRVEGARVEVERAGDWRVEPSPESPDAAGRSERWLVRVHAPPGLEPGPLRGTLVLELDDEQHPELRAPVLGTAR